MTDTKRLAEMFREIGLTPDTTQPVQPPIIEEPRQPTETFFVRADNNTKSCMGETDAELAGDS